MAYLEPYNENSHMFLLFLPSYSRTWFNPSREDELGKLPPWVGIIKKKHMFSNFWPITWTWRFTEPLGGQYGGPLNHDSFQFWRAFFFNPVVQWPTGKRWHFGTFRPLPWNSWKKSAWKWIVNFSEIVNFTSHKVVVHMGVPKMEVPNNHGFSY